MASSGGPRRTSALFMCSLHEVGVARILFNADFSSFKGVLINYQGESFSLHGTPHTNALYLNDSGQDTMNNDDDQIAGTSFDVSVVDGETGNEFVLKRIQLKVGLSSAPSSSSPMGGHFPSAGGLMHSPSFTCELLSDSLKFRTEEVLVGNRADMEIRTYMSPDLTGNNSTVHVGTMTINVQNTVTPPPTPQRDNGDGETPMEQSDDFLQ